MALPTSGRRREKKGFELMRIGQALLLLGILLALMVGTIFLLSSPSLSAGWEGVWVVPRSEFLFACPLSTALVALGLLLILLGGRGRPRRRVDVREGSEEE